jgi:hypothetical protein
LIGRPYYEAVGLVTAYGPVLTSLAEAILDYYEVPKVKISLGGLPPFDASSFAFSNDELIGRCSLTGGDRPKADERYLFLEGLRVEAASGIDLLDGIRLEPMTDADRSLFLNEASSYEHVELSPSVEHVSSMITLSRDLKNEEIACVLALLRIFLRRGDFRVCRVGDRIPQFPRCLGSRFSFKFSYASYAEPALNEPGFGPLKKTIHSDEIGGVTEFFREHWNRVSNKFFSIAVECMRIQHGTEPVFRILILMLALESFFQNVRHEATYRLSQLVAHLMGKKRKEWYDAMRGIYKYRSDIVHGTSWKPPKNLLRQIEALCGRSGNGVDVVCDTVFDVVSRVWIAIMEKDLHIDPDSLETRILFPAEKATDLA